MNGAKFADEPRNIRPCTLSEAGRTWCPANTARIRHQLSEGVPWLSRRLNLPADSLPRGCPTLSASRLRNEDPGSRLFDATRTTPAKWTDLAHPECR
jgi:hypothetical protein